MNNNFNLTFLDNLRWARQFDSEIIRLLERYRHQIDPLKIASLYEDMKQATDIKSERIEVAIRMRRHNCRHRQITLRSQSKFDVDVELDKMKGGWANVGFYGWADKHDRLDEWCMYSIDCMRRTGLLWNPDEKERWNKDGKNAFDIWDRATIRNGGCIIHEQLNVRREFKFLD